MGQARAGGRLGLARRRPVPEEGRDLDEPRTNARGRGAALGHGARGPRVQRDASRARDADRRVEAVAGERMLGRFAAATHALRSSKTFCLPSRRLGYRVHEPRRRAQRAGDRAPRRPPGARHVEAQCTSRSSASRARGRSCSSSFAGRWAATPISRATAQTAISRKTRFATAGLGLEFQKFNPPRYPQPVAEHVPGLSVADALMSCGWQGTAKLLRPGRQP